MSRASVVPYHRRRVLSGSLVAVLILVAFALPSAAATAPTYVGSEDCIGCHEQQSETLSKTPHGKAAFANQTALGCEDCHGPGSLHVEDPEVVANRPRVSDLSVDKLNETCTGCHDGGRQMMWKGSPHEQRDVACTDCHSVHDYKSVLGQLKAATAMETCFECHKEVRAETRKASHHPIREGKIGCNDCHNPHGTGSDSMMIAASVNDQCYECHAEKRGPFLWEHAPVRENCLNCHTPHGSNHAKLQKTAIPYSCQECHSNTRHPGTIYDASKLFAESGEENSSPSNRVFNRACLNCHASIHGSNHPSGPYLGR